VKVLVTGAAGMLGRSVVERFAADRPEVEVVPVTRREADLRDRVAVRRVIEAHAPDAIVHAAAKVGGIGIKLAEPTPFLLDNLLMDSSVIASAMEVGVPELLYVGSAAVYPAVYDHPYVEDDMLTGRLESVNEGYALAKAAAAKVCEYASRQHGLRYRTALPSNLYGIHDHFGLGDAHLIAAALAKVHAARESGERFVEVWGDGTARREFTYSVDVAAWLVDQIGRLDAWPPVLNIGVGDDHSIEEYYRVAMEVVGFDGELRFDTSKPSGVPRRLIDSSAARALGWNPSTSLVEGMTATYRDYLSHVNRSGND
jgi:GDP-L-fucose synthase